MFTGSPSRTSSPRAERQGQTRPCRCARWRRGGGRACCVEGATAATATAGSPPSSAPRLEVDVTAHPETRQRGSSPPHDPGHHAAARRDEPRLCARRTTSDGPLGHDDDAEGVRERPVELGRDDRRAASRPRAQAVACRAPASSCRRLARALGSTWRATGPGRTADLDGAQGEDRRLPSDQPGAEPPARSANASTSERAEGTRRSASRRTPLRGRAIGTTTLAGRTRGRDARSPRPRPAMAHRSARPSALLLRSKGGSKTLPLQRQRREGEAAQENDLVLEGDSVLAPSVRRRHSAISARQSAVVAPPAFSMKFACFGETTAPPTRCALQAAELEQPPCAELAGRILEDRSERPLVRRLRLLPPRDEVGDLGLDLGSAPGASSRYSTRATT